MTVAVRVVSRTWISAVVRALTYRELWQWTLNAHISLGKIHGNSVQVQVISLDELSFVHFDARITVSSCSETAIKSECTNIWRPKALRKKTYTSLFDEQLTRCFLNAIQKIKLELINRKLLGNELVLLLLQQSRTYTKYSNLWIF